MAVLVLQAFAVEGGAPGGAAQQEAARLHVAGGPGQVAHPLQAEHRVVDVERHHDAVVRRVRRRRGHPAGHAARLVDAFLQDLPGLVFLVVGHLVAVLRGVLLAFRVVDPDLAEQPLHAEGARLVHQDGHGARAELLVAQQRGQEAHEGLRGADLAALGGGVQHRLEGLQRRHLHLLVGLRAALGQVAAQRLAAGVQVLHLRRVLFRLVEGDLRQLVVRDGDVEAVAEGADVLVAHLLGLVGDVLALAGPAHAEALDGLDQQHRGLALVVDRAVIGRVDLLRVMAAAVEAPDVLVAHVRDHLQQLGVAAEEVLAHVGAVVGLHVPGSRRRPRPS